MKIIIAILVAVLFFLVLNIFTLGLKRLLVRYPALNFSDNFRAAIIFLTWFIYIFWLTDFLFSGKFFYHYLIYTLILIVAGFFAWFLLKDIFAGIIFRVKHNLKTGSYIRAGEIAGQVKSQELTYLKILTGEGQILRVPYSGIILKVITELPFPGALEEHSLQIEVDLSAGNANTSEALIRTVVLNSPWSSLKEEPTIRFLKENEKGFVFEITLLSINKRQIKYIEMALEEVPVIRVIS